MTDSAIDSHGATARPAARPVPAILVGGFIVGVLDLLYAIVVYSPRRPILIGQSIASGLLGRQAFSGGAKSAALGVFLHFVISIGAATVYYLASRALPILIDRVVICGLIYGALVYGFMHVVVLPLSAAHHRQVALIYPICEFVEHWFCVGLPIALSVRHYSRPLR